MRFLAYALASAAFKAGLPRAEGEIDVNLAVVSERLGVSRTHARRIVDMLEAAGLVARGDRPSRLILTPAFADGVELYFLGMFSVLMVAVGL